MIVTVLRSGIVELKTKGGGRRRNLRDLNNHLFLAYLSDYLKSVMVASATIVSFWCGIFRVFLHLPSREPACLESVLFLA